LTSTPIQVAVVGYGLASKVFHAPLIAATPGLRLNTIVSSAPEKVRADWPEVGVTAILSEVLDDPAIRLIVIATPDHLHAEQALAALARGKLVVVDKPLAPSLAEARQVIACAKATGQLLTVFQNRRWDSDFLTLKRLIAENTLGEIVQFESHFDRLRPASTDRWKDHRAAGLWQDLGPHLVDQVLQLFGVPSGVYADLTTQRVNGAAPDYAHVLLRYPHRRVILHMTQSVHASGLRFAVHGTTGSYIKHGLDPQEDQSKAGMKPSDGRWGVDDSPGLLTRITPEGNALETTIPNARGNYAAFYAQVHTTICNGGPPPVTPAEAVDVMTIIEAGKISAAEGREVLICEGAIAG
jgi:predicted dehydrogenase